MIGRRGFLNNKQGLWSFIGVIILMLTLIGLYGMEGKTDGYEVSANTTEESDYGRDNVTRLEVYNMEGKYEHMVYDYVPFYVGMTLSDDAVTLNGATLEITLPKNIIDSRYIMPSAIESMERVEIVETEEHHVVTYYLKNLAGGVTVDIPINFRTTRGLVPEGYPLEVVATIKDRDGLIIEESEPMIYTMRTLKARTFKAIQGYNSTFVDYEYFGFEDENNKGYLTTDLDRTPSVPFYAGVTPSDRELIEVELIDELPEGAVFDAELTEGWEYDEETHTATITHKGRLIASNQFPFRSPPIYLKFPGFKIGERVVNKVYSKSTPNQKAEYEEIITGESDEAVIIRKIEIPEGLDGKKSTSANIIYDLEDDKAREFKWRLTLHNPADEITGMNLYDAKIIDRDLSEHLKYVGVYFFPVSGTQGRLKGIVGGMDIEVFYRDGTSEMVMENEDWEEYYNETVYFPRQEDIIRVEVRSSDGSYIPPKQTQYLDMVTTFRKPEEKIVTGNDSFIRIENYADFEGRYEGLEVFKSTSKGSIRVNRPPKNGLTMIKRGDVNAPSSYVSGDIVSYVISADLGGYYQKGRVIELTQLVDILPEGMEYEKGSSQIRFWGREYITTDIKEGKVEPQIITNYQETGRTALVWELGYVNVTKTNMTYQSFFNISYQTRVTNLLDPLKTENNAYLAWKNTEEVEARRRSSGSVNGVYDDIYDLNNNGRVDDKIIGASMEISYIPPYELIINKKGKRKSRQGVFITTISGNK